MAKKGITPVIATVLLLMLAVGAVGGAFAFIRGIQQDVIDQILTQRETEMQLNMMNCYTHIGSDGDTGVFEMDIENTGERVLKTNPANFEVIMPDGDINYTLTKRGISLSRAAIEGGATEGVYIKRDGGTKAWPGVGSYVVYQINATSGYKLEPNTPYQVKLTLTRQSETISTTCRASRP